MVGTTDRCLPPSQVQEAKVTEVKINEAREHYRPAAARASLLYFIMNDLSKIHPMYQFSLKVTYSCSFVHNHHGTATTALRESFSVGGRSWGRSSQSRPGGQLQCLQTHVTNLSSLIGSFRTPGLLRLEREVPRPASLGEDRGQGGC